VDLLGALGRVLSRDVTSKGDVPGFPRSTVDGYAVRAADTFGAGESGAAYLGVSGEVLIGRRPETGVVPGRCARIPTGGMLPDGADAVVMIEHVEDAGPSMIAVTKPVAPGENVVRADEDLAEGQTALRGGTRLRPQEIGVLAAIGATEVPVYRRPAVAILSTGEEIVDPDHDPPPGKVRDVNSRALVASVQRDGGVPRLLGIARGGFDEVLSAVERGLECDMVLVSGGSSVGEHDVTPRVIDALGEPGVLVHGIAIKPGKPTIIGIARGRPVFGLPGHPVSALVAYRVIVRPALRMISGEAGYADPEPTAMARMACDLESPPGRTEFVRVTLREEGGALWAHPVRGASGLISTLASADGIAVVGVGRTGVAEGDEVRVLLD